MNEYFLYLFNDQEASLKTVCENTTIEDFIRDISVEGFLPENEDSYDLILHSAYDRNHKIKVTEVFIVLPTTNETINVSVPDDTNLEEVLSQLMQAGCLPAQPFEYYDIALVNRTTQELKLLNLSQTLPELGISDHDTLNILSVSVDGGPDIKDTDILFVHPCTNEEISLTFPNYTPLTDVLSHLIDVGFLDNSYAKQYCFALIDENKKVLHKLSPWDFLFTYDCNDVIRLTLQQYIPDLSLLDTKTEVFIEHPTTNELIQVDIPNSITLKEVAEQLVACNFLSDEPFGYDFAVKYRDKTCSEYLDATVKFMELNIPDNTILIPFACAMRYDDNNIYIGIYSPDNSDYRPMIVPRSNTLEQIIEQLIEYNFISAPAYQYYIGLLNEQNEISDVLDKTKSLLELDLPHFTSLILIPIYGII